MVEHSRGRVPDSARETHIRLCYNYGIITDGSNIDEAPAPKTDPHVCNQLYEDVQDFDKDLADLVATCQRHTRCSAA